MQTSTYREPRYPKKWIFAPAAVLLICVVPTMALFRQSKGSLTGSVTYQGKTVTTGFVILESADGSTRFAPIDQQGRYSIDGVATGPVKIGVMSRDPAKLMLRQQKMVASSDRLTEADRMHRPTNSAQKWFAIPANYEDPRTSGLSTTVQGQTEHRIDMR